MTHLFMAAGIIGMAAAIFALGWQSNKVWVDWRDDRALRAAERHTHRKGDPQETTLLALPRAGRIPLERLADPAPLPGESWDIWPVSGPAEYELLTQTIEQPAADPVTGERPIDTGEIRAIDERVDEWIEQYTAQTNEFIHSMPRVIIDG